MKRQGATSTPGLFASIAACGIVGAYAVAAALVGACYLCFVYPFRPKGEAPTAPSPVPEPPKVRAAAGGR